MARREQRIEHLLRRVGFGGSPDEVAELTEVGYQGAVDLLVFHELVADDVDARIGTSGHVGVGTRSQFLPDTSINDSRQRWLFRMVHSRRPLQEKMALFWHHHFATAHSKISSTYGSTLATRMMAAPPPTTIPGRRRPGRSNSSARPVSAASTTCWWPWRATRRCWCGSTAGSTSRARPRRTSPAR